jgi:quinol monooxygenase YgiN
MIHVLATLDLAPATREAFLTEFRKIIPDVKAENGCIEYGPAVDADSDLPNHFRIGPDRVMVIEKWESVAALKAHSTAPHMLAYRARVKDYIKGMELRLLSPA